MFGVTAGQARFDRDTGAIAFNSTGIIRTFKLNDGSATIAGNPNGERLRSPLPGPPDVADPQRNWIDQ